MPVRQFTKFEAGLIARTVLFNRHNCAYHVYGEQARRTAAKLKKEGFMSVTSLRRKPACVQYVALHMTEMGNHAWAQHVRRCKRQAMKQAA